MERVPPTMPEAPQCREGAGGSTVSVVVLAYGRHSILREVIDSILQQSGVTVELIIVLNGPDSELEQILREYPSLRVVRNAENLDFPAGMNSGICVASADYVYAAGNDLVLAPGYLALLVQELEVAETAVGFCCGLWCDYQTREIENAGARLNWGWRFHTTPLRQPLQESRSYPVDWILGACMLGRRQTWWRLGGFREDFFLNYEDIDLCLRARALGLVIQVTPGARCYHHAHPRTNANPFVEWHKLKNYFSVAVRFAPPASAVVLVLKYYCCTAVQVAWRLHQPTFMARSWVWATLHLAPLIWERLRGNRMPPHQGIT